MDQQTTTKVVDHYQKVGNLDLMARMYAILGLKDEAKRQAKSREAESNFVNKKLYGADPLATGDDMGDTIVFGDMKMESPQQPQESTLAKLVKYGGLLATGGLAAVAVPAVLDWLSSDIPEPQPPTHTETTRDYQIGEITIE